MGVVARPRLRLLAPRSRRRRRRPDRRLLLPGLMLLAQQSTSSDVPLKSFALAGLAPLPFAGALLRFPGFTPRRWLSSAAPAARRRTATPSAWPAAESLRWMTLMADLRPPLPTSAACRRVFRPSRVAPLFQTFSRGKTASSNSVAAPAPAHRPALSRREGPRHRIFRSRSPRSKTTSAVQQGRFSGRLPSVAPRPRSRRVRRVPGRQRETENVRRP